MSDWIASRRTFLKGTAVTALAGMMARVAANPLATAVAPTLQTFSQRLLGPIHSNPCPFKADLSLDDAGQRKAIARALNAGICVFACTAGNTQYATLNFDEIKQVNRVMIEAVAGRGLAIAATGDWTTEQVVEFARYISQIKPDALQVLLPQKLAQDEDAATAHFEAVAKAASLPLVLHGKFSDALLGRLVKIDSVVAMKEDHQLEDFVRQQIDFGQRLAIFGGGGENRYYVGYPYGAKAYYSTYSTFAPDISAKVWSVIQSGDIKGAAQLTVKYDYPFIRRFSHGLWHATLELFHISSRHVRPPQKTLTDEQLAELKKFFESQGISPDKYS